MTPSQALDNSAASDCSRSNTTMRKVVVTGLGFVTCIGRDKSAVTRNLREMRHGLRVYEPFAAMDVPVKVAAPIDEFDVDSLDQEDWTFPDGMPRMRLDQLRGLPPHGAYALYSMHQAIADAGLGAEEISNPTTGLFTASVGSPSRLYANLARMKDYGPNRCPPLGIVASIAGSLSFNLVSYYKIKGSSTGFVSACASSGHALGYAFDEIALGRQDRMFVVGAEDCTVETILPFLSMRALSTNPDPNTASRPFDRKRDGFVGTGGAVTLVLEEEDAARKRGATIYCRMLGWGQGTDGHHVAMSHPEGEGLERAMKNALKNAGLEAGKVDYLNAHATSTPIGDTSELRAIKKTFAGTEGPAVSSTKALTGHALSLSSVMEAAFTVLSLNAGLMPGSANIEELDPEAEGVNILRKSEERPYNIAMSNSSGFGGANVSVIFGK